MDRKSEPKNFLRLTEEHTNLNVLEQNLGLTTADSEIISIPFVPQWAFGIDVDVKFFNLTTDRTKWKIFYTVTHIGIIYDYKKNGMQFLLGHKNYITSISVDSTGKWLVTADNGTDNSVIIWDSEDCFPICTIYEPYGEDGVIQLALSQNGKYLVTLGNESEQPVIKFWLWTLGNDTPEAKYAINKSYGEIKIITFNPNECEHFAITFSEAVLFCTWDLVSRSIKVLEGEILNEKSKNYGTFNDTTYLYLSHQCYTVTSNGWVIIWGLTFLTVAYESIPTSNDKIFIKAIRLQKDAIRTICTVENNYLVTTNLNGQINFYDRKFRIKFHTQPNSIPPAILISFNVGKLSEELQDLTFFDSDEKEKEELLKKNEIRSNNNILCNLLPSDYSLQRAPFLTRDYIILTTDGQFAYVDAIKNKYFYFLNTNYYPVTSMDIHSEKAILCVGYEDGAINSFNFEKRILVAKKTITNLKEEAYNEISSIRFSYKGLFLVCGTSGGCVWFLDPVTLEPVYKKPFFYDHMKILDIKFSLDNLYLAYYDDSMAVCVLKRCIDDDKIQNWIFYGRYVAHTKPIVGLVFSNGCKLFSVSEDNYIVEYYVKGSTPGKLDILSRMCLMRRGRTIYFTTFNACRESEVEFFLFSTREYKYVILNEETFQLERIILCPMLGQPIQQMEIIPNRDEKYMIYMSGKYLGIQKIPLSGSPSKQICLVAHSSCLRKFCISKCGKYVFTYGEKDNVCIMWKINPEPLEKLVRQGGEELKPYYPLIEGGPNGWLFQEMKDLFYYMQILHQGEDSPSLRKTSDKIPITEVPNLMRALGYFPTEYELDCVLFGLKYYVSQSENENVDVISFENFIKLYLNYKCGDVNCTRDFKWAFQVLGDENGVITREKFIKLLCEEGEPFSLISLDHCLSILTHQDHIEEQSRHTWKEMLPNELTYEYFVSELLGVEEQD